MYFTSVIRYSPEHGRELPYYKIKESFRDVLGRVRTRLMLTPGYMPELCTDEIVQIRIGLSYLWQESATIPGEKRLFDADPRINYSEKVRKRIDKFWKEMKEKGTFCPVPVPDRKNDIPGINNNAVSILIISIIF